MAFGVGTVAAVISAAISFTAMSIPKPEIYTTNGNSVKENEVYFSTEWPLTVKYTLVPYDDPMKNGEEFKENIPIIRSMAVSAKATLLVHLSIVIMESSRSLYTSWLLLSSQ